MRNGMIKAIPLLLLSASLDAFACELAWSSPRFDVRCDFGGARSANPDRLLAKQEVGLLRRAIEDTYPRLSLELREVAQKIVFVASHRETAWTKLVFGWGPEDDADYRYPDTEFFPQGTIKVSFSEKTIAALALGERLSRSGPDVAEGARMFARFVIAHELTHALQYHQAPVRDVLALHRLSGAWSICKEGLLDEALLVDEEKRLEYEKEAYGMHRRFINKGFLLAFADAVESYERKHRRQFSEGGRYYLLASSRPNPFVGKLREEASMAGKGGEFGPLAKFPNEGQVVPVQIVWALKQINDNLAGYADPRTMVQRVKPQVEELRARWDLFMSGKDAERVKAVVPCDPGELGRRYRAELERYEALTQTLP